ncbi:MAG: MFS transporter [Clostridiales bacterium]|nr:MFS transporter [Clostridiales bacterium]
MTNSELKEAKNGGRFHYAFLVFISCCSITFVSVSLYFSCNGIFYTPVSEYFGVGRGVFAVSGTIMSIVMGIFSPLVGTLMEKFSFRKMLILFLLLQISAYVIQANAGSVFVFYFTGILHGIVHSLMMLMVVPTIINRWFDVRRGLFVGLASSMSGVGGIVWNNVAGRFMESHSWQATYMLYAILIACIPLPLVIFVLRDYPSQKGLKPYGYSEIPGTTVSNFVPEETEKRGLTAAEANKTMAFWFLVLMNLGVGVVTCFTSFVPSYATSLGLSITFGALLSSVVGLGILLGKNTTGMLFDKNVNIGVFVANFFPAIGLGLFYVFGALGMYNLMPIGSAFFGISYAAGPVLLPLLIMHVFGTKEYGKILGNINMYGSLLGAVIGVVFGVISDIPGGNGFFILLIICFVCAILATIFGLLTVKKGEDLY